LMGQPLLSRGRLLGVIAMGRSDPTAPFEDRDLALLQRFATHAALALNNAMLYDEAERRRRAAEALAAMARALSETRDVSTISRQVADRVKAFFDFDCTVRLIRGDGGLVAVASTDVAAGPDQAAPALEGAQLHADLQTSEERTRLIIDTALDAVVTIDLEGRIIGWNAQAERTFGWAREDAIGKILSETIIPPQYRDAHEAGL